MSSNATLRWASVMGTLLLAALSAAVAMSAPKPSDAPLHPAVKPLASNAGVQSTSYVS